MARTAWVECGATWAEVDAATQAHGLAKPGADLGNRSYRVHPERLDAVQACLSNVNPVAAEVVTADRPVCQASAESHPDLFWALRGGGGNFGVDLRFCFALDPFGPDLTDDATAYSGRAAGFYWIANPVWDVAADDAV